LEKKTPHHKDLLLHTNQIFYQQEANKSLKYYRGISRNSFNEDLEIKIELQSLLSSVNSSLSPNFSLSDLKEKHAKKAFIYGICLMALNQLCGCFAMINFTATIFKESGSTLSPNVSSIIVGVIQIIGGVFCTFFVERAGRKMMLLISAFFTSTGLAVMSLYSFLNSQSVDLSSFKFIPLLAFSFVIFMSQLGIMSLPFVYLSEIVPIKTKGFTMMFCLSSLYVFGTIVIQVRNFCFLWQIETFYSIVVSINPH
jgi:hypothetical protein